MIETLATERWIARDAVAPAPTFFARPAWSLALERAFAHLLPFPALVRSANGQPLLVPMMRSSGGTLRWRELIGMPLGSYTCALRDDGTLASAAECGAALEELGRAYDAVSITPWPLAPAGVPAAWTTRTHETAVVDLRDGADAAVARFEGVVRRMAGQAVRRGVVCEPCIPAQSGVETYYAMLRESAARWGVEKPPFPKVLLEALVEFGGTNVEIWFAHAHGEAIAGGVVMYGARELFFWSAAMRQSGARLRPSNALNEALIRAAARRGMQWYNLGSSEGLAGVERFKRGLGARVVRYTEGSRQRAAFKIYSRVRASFPRRSARVPA